MTFVPPQGSQEVGAGNFHKWAQEGEAISGLLIKVEKSRKYREGYVAKMKTASGPVAFSCPTILRDVIDSNKLVGEWVAIQYTGKTKSASGQEVSQFKVFKLAGPVEGVADAGAEGDDDLPF